MNPISPFIRWLVDIRLRQLLHIPYGYVDNETRFKVDYHVYHSTTIESALALAKGEIRMSILARMYEHYWGAMP